MTTGVPVNETPAPEPSTIALFLSTVGGLGLRKYVLARRQREPSPEQQTSDESVTDRSSASGSTIALIDPARPDTSPRNCSRPTLGALRRGFFIGSSMPSHVPIYLRLSQLAIAANQSIRRAVVLQLGFGVALELGDDPFGQDLAKLDAPLVERVDVPDRALREDTVLIECDQGPESFGREAFGQEDVRRPVALERAVRHQPVGRSLGLDRFGRLAERQGLGLGEDVGHQQVVMVAQRD